MIRDITKFTEKKFDALVIGGGIYGACVAWEAALRGLSVALIEKDDFGHATSANSLKIIHGGLRYLQEGNLRLVRRMVHERQALMRIAPHLVQPLPCVMPTYTRIKQNRSVLGAALILNDLLSFDKNRKLTDPKQHLPRSRIISGEEALEWMPGIAERDLTGGAVWHDAQILNTERFTLSFILSTTELGGCVANYIEAVEFLQDDQKIVGVRARDLLNNSLSEIHADVIVNTTGPWSQKLLQLIQSAQNPLPYRPSVAMNLVTKQVINDHAIAVRSPSRSINSDRLSADPQLLFLVPWRGYSLIGTKHFLYHGAGEGYQTQEEEVLGFLREINSVYPRAALTPNDIYLIHNGFLPDISKNGAKKVKLLRENKIIDHKAEDNIDGLITIVGVKYTTARYGAELAVDLVCTKLQKQLDNPSQTAATPIFGGEIDDMDKYLENTLRHRPEAIDENSFEHIVRTYGSSYWRVLNYNQILGWADRVCSDSPVIKAEVIFAVREEMALMLTDILLRRTELGSAGKPSKECISNCGQIMADELRWDRPRLKQEIADVDSYYAARTLA